LGPMLTLLPALERARGRIASTVATFGQVPFFFYLLHLPLIHGLALAVDRLRGGTGAAWLVANHPMMAPEPPQAYPWTLPLLYLVFATAIVLLYFPCRWFAGLKARRASPWLGFL
jgi:hypothetical protein